MAEGTAETPENVSMERNGEARKVTGKVRAGGIAHRCDNYNSSA
jgi:hypothetical protein